MMTNVHYLLQSVLETNSDVLVIPCFEEVFWEEMTIQVLDKALGGWLKKSADLEHFAGRKSQSLLIPTYGKTRSSKVLLLGMGSSVESSPSDFRHAAVRVMRMASSSSIEVVSFAMPNEKYWENSKAVSFLAEGALLGGYRFDKYLTQDKKRRSLERSFQIIFSDEHSCFMKTKQIEADIRRGNIIARSMMNARDWVNESPSVMTPERLADIAKDMAKANHQLKTTVFSEEQCRKMGMNLLLAVGQGSALPSTFIHVVYHPPKSTDEKKTIALVGKGVTFDSGGVAIKTPQGMMDMKCDMAGAATVLAVMEAIAQLGSPHEVHALVPCVENMTSGDSYRLRDIVTSMSGKTVEITNTDAEGRLIIADAMTYALTHVRPGEIIDIATLTGAVVVALGPYMAGVMGNDKNLIDRFMAAAAEVSEEMWHLPIPDFTMDNLKSDVADLKNAGDRNGGSLTAARFIQEFVGEVPWIHLDIAGTAFLDKEHGYSPKGATGFGVPAFIEYLTQSV